MLAATVVAPDYRKVIPLFPEFISPQDGDKKQDCERKAVKRWHAQHADRLRHLRPIYLGDDIFTCQPIVQMLLAKGDDFIFTCKDVSHKALCDFINGAEFEHHEEKICTRKKVYRHRWRWIEGVPLRDGNDAVLVNWIQFEIVDHKGEIKYSSAWVTSLPLNKQNVAEVVTCARARWKTENEAFNVLKNRGYELEHNFSHGKKFLAMTLVTLNLLAFGWHTVLDILDPPWQAARKASGTRAEFFQFTVAYTARDIFESWADLLEALTIFVRPSQINLRKNE